MPEPALTERTCRYILERQCQSGGFCFYRLEEPNGADTFYALATLHMLGKTLASEVTRRFLEGTQRADGMYDNLYQAYYAIRGLAYLRSAPKQDPRPYLETQIHRFPVENATLETQLKRLDILTDLCTGLCIEIPSEKREAMIDFILSYYNGDRGFGDPASGLLTTAYAVASLARLSYPVASLETVRFLRACEHPVHGFLDVPDMAPSFLEHIMAGAIASQVLGYTPRYLEACLRFVIHCQSTNGGFARAPGGLPTLQDTYRAISTLIRLEALQKGV